MARLSALFRAFRGKLRARKDECRRSFIASSQNSLAAVNAVSGSKIVAAGITSRRVARNQLHALECRNGLCASMPDVELGARMSACTRAVLFADIGGNLSRRPQGFAAVNA